MEEVGAKETHVHSYQQTTSESSADSRIDNLFNGITQPSASPPPPLSSSREIKPITNLTEDLRNKIRFRSSLESAFRAISYLPFWHFRSKEIKAIYQACKEFDHASPADKPGKAKELLTLIAAWEKSKGKSLNQMATKPAVDALKSLLSQSLEMPAVSSQAQPVAAANLQDVRASIERMDSLDLKGCEETIKSVRIALNTIVAQKLPPGSPLVAEVQELNTTMMKKYFEKLALVAQAQLDKPMPEGCKFTFLLLGSAATGTTSPMSDIDFAIVCENPKHKDYLDALAQKMHSLNNKEAFPLCSQVTPQGPFLGEYLIGTVEEFNKWQLQANAGRGSRPMQEAMKALSVNVAAGGNAKEIAARLQVSTPQKELAVSKLNSVFDFTWPGSERFDVKHALIRSPTLFIEGLCLLHNVGTSESNIWEKLAALKKAGKIDEKLANRITSLLQFAYQVRYVSHLKSGQEQDTVFLKAPDYAANNYLVLSDTQIFGTEKELETSLLQMVETLEEIKTQCHLAIDEAAK